MVAPDEITQLVGHFALHREDYQRSGYLEVQLRQEFINPMFQWLGWDMDNRQGFAEAYKDVIHEDAICIGGVRSTLIAGMRLRRCSHGKRFSKVLKLDRTS